jgi:hyperosmotically inducible periplasmic protein
MMFILCLLNWGNCFINQGLDMKRYFMMPFLAVLLTILSGCQTFSGSSNIMGSKHPSDSSINASVIAALDNSNQFAGVPITVETKNSSVLLSGYVKTIRQSDVAADLASKVDGVKFVENNLIVRK